MLIAGMTELGPLTQVVARTLGRVRLQRAIESATAGLAVSFAVGCSVRLVQRWLFFRNQNEPLWLVGISLAAALVAWLWPLKRETIAARIDRAHAFHDRVQSALEFAERKDRSRFMEAAIQDAVTRASTLSPQRAAPFSAPRARYVTLLCGALWIGAGLLPARRVQITTHTPIVRATALSQDELSGFRDELASLESAAPVSAEQEQLRAAYRTLLDRIAGGGLDRSASIEALLSLEKRLMPDTHGELGANQAALSELAKDLAKADETLAGALLKQDPNAAAEALAALAKNLKTRPEAQRARLKEALEGIKRRSEATESNRKRQDELESLLKRKESPKTPEEKRLLERNKRELERLRRDNQTARERSRELERLDRDLADAAQALGNDGFDQAENSLQRGAEDLKRLGQEQGTREQREALAKQVAQLRELLQRQREQNNGKGQAKKSDGSSQQERSKRFTMRAGGQDPDAEDAMLLAPKTGKEGEKGGSGKEPGEKDGEQSAQQGKPGQQGKPAFELGGAGPGSAELELPGSTQVVGDSQPKASDEHDTRRLGNATDLDSELRDSQVAGTISKGPARSEVILDAADRGFATAPYRKVYSEYRSHAEEALDKEDIPAGYRFYVRRYFQLIRPREERKAP